MSTRTTAACVGEVCRARAGSRMSSSTWKCSCPPRPRAEEGLARGGGGRVGSASEALGDDERVVVVARELGERIVALHGWGSLVREGHERRRDVHDHRAVRPSMSISQPARSGSCGTKRASVAVGARWSSSPRVRPRCSVQTTSWFSHRWRYGRLPGRTPARPCVPCSFWGKPGPPGPPPPVLGLLGPRWGPLGRSWALWRPPRVGPRAGGGVRGASGRAAAGPGGRRRPGVRPRGPPPRPLGRSSGCGPRGWPAGGSPGRRCGGVACGWGGGGWGRFGVPPGPHLLRARRHARARDGAAAPEEALPRRRAADGLARAARPPDRDARVRGARAGRATARRCWPSTARRSSCCGSRCTTSRARTRTCSTRSRRCCRRSA